MKLLRIGGKLINWDLVTDVRIGEDRSGTKKIYVQFGTHRIQLTGPEATGFERWMVTTISSPGFFTSILKSIKPNWNVFDLPLDLVVSDDSPSS